MPTIVRRRLVFYCPGYDAATESRYRQLFVAEFARLARRFAIHREIGPVEMDEAVPSIRWGVVASNGEWRTETAYEVLRWDDLIRRDLSRTWRKRAPLLLAGILVALREGVISRLFRIDWHFAVALCYPVVALLGLAVGAPLIGYGFVSVLGVAMPLAPAASGLIAVAFAAALMCSVQPLLRKAYVYHVTDDWIFNWQHTRGERPDFDARLNRFSERIVAAVWEGGAEEILVVGHSTGAILAVEAVARALALDVTAGCRGPRLVLLTIGSRVPLAALWSSAHRFRAALSRLATEPSVLWVDYQAPQDPFNAFRFDPVRDLQLELRGGRTNPMIRSPRFKDTSLPDSYRRKRWNFFQMHFRFLMANERPGEYDYLMITCGPVSLAERIADPAAALRLTYGTAVPRSPIAPSQRRQKQAISTNDGSAKRFPPFPTIA